MLPLLKKKVSFITVLILIISSSLATLLITKRVLSKADHNLALNTQASASSCDFHIKRLDGFGMIKPILMVENDCESEQFQLLKNEIRNTIIDYQNEGTLSAASVYLRDFTSGDWICINGSEEYAPGSMLKVAVLITYLKMSEEQPGLLEKKFLLEKPINLERKAVNISKFIQTGSYYTVKELLKYMIQYSDNNATYLLNKNMDTKTFQQIFADFGNEVPDRKASEYLMNVADYSKFMRVLYNGSYLSRENSEFAVELLSHSDFNKGVLKGVPSGIHVAHKFGEEGTSEQPQLHESAIVYYKDIPYLLTIMTKGHNLEKQARVLADISAQIYRFIAS